MMAAREKHVRCKYTEQVSFESDIGKRTGEVHCGIQCSRCPLYPENSLQCSTIMALISNSFYRKVHIDKVHKDKPSALRLFTKKYVIHKNSV